MNSDMERVRSIALAANSYVSRVNSPKIRLEVYGFIKGW